MYARVFKMLISDPCTAHNIVEEIGMHLVTAQSLMRCLNRHKIIHICAWEKDVKGRDCTQVYKFGKGVNKARHKMTAAERAARYKQKKKMLEFTNILHKKS